MLSHAISIRRSLFLAFILALTVVGPSWVQADGLPEPDLKAMRRQIEKNGWDFEVSDEFSKSITPETRLNLRSGYNMSDEDRQEMESNLKIFPVSKDPLPINLDWRTMNGVTGIRDQGSCGSCWAFAATAEMESFIKIYYGKDVNLSEQQSVSCNSYGASCDGGWAAATYECFQYQGAVSEGCMPYLAQDFPEAPCIQDGKKKYGYITGYHYISNNVNQIKQALQTGPVCTSISATDLFEGYSGGCFEEYDGNTNHLVLIVGYDDRGCGGQGVWIIKNSWGGGWGEGGYGYVKYGAGGTGIGVTQLHYVAPPTSIDIVGGLEGTDLLAEEDFDIVWNTTGTPVGTVDIWLGLDDACHDELIAANVPNNGSYTWTVPNFSTDYAGIVIHPSTGMQDGYGTTEEHFSILGHAARYVSSHGSNTAPYDTPAKAAHSIQDAILACSGADTVFVAEGLYQENLVLGGPFTLLGGYDLDFTDRDVVAHLTEIRSGLTAVRIAASSGDKGVVDGFKFSECAGGVSPDPVGGRHGGAIVINNASPEIRNCSFVDNIAHPVNQLGYGGAVIVLGGSPTLTDCAFLGNSASRGGGLAVFADAQVTLENCVFEGNGLTDGLEGYIGGALYVEDSSLVMNGGHILGSTMALAGGGIYAQSSHLTLNDVTFAQNSAHEGGGGLWINESSLQMNRCLVENNMTNTGTGAGIGGMGSAVAIRNTRFHANTGSNIGGGFGATGVSGVIENCLFTENESATGGGLFCLGTGEMVVRNNIVMNSQGSGMLVGGSELYVGHNNLWGNLPDHYGPGMTGEQDISLEPLFVDAAAGDFGLAQHSPCVDAGQDDASCLDPDGSRADMGILGGPGADFVAPSRVTGAALTASGDGQVRVSWNASAEENISHYVVYRDSAAVFVPTDLRAIAVVNHPATVYVDTPPAPCYYLIAAVDADGYSSGYSDRVYNDGHGSISAAGDAPRVLAITGVVPNPFNPMTEIRFDLPSTGRVDLRVYDLRGRMVRELIAGQMESGRHDIVWNGRDNHGQAAAAGVYFARLVAADGIQTMKMVLAK